MSESATIGHNKPPLVDPEDLKIRFADLAARAEVIAERANGLPTAVTTDEQLGDYAPVVKDARAMLNEAEAVRVEEGAPLLAGTRAINAYFKTITERMDRIVRSLEMRASKYQSAKAAKARRKAQAEADRIRAEEEHRRKLAIAEDERNRPKAADKQEAKAEHLARQADEVEAITRAPAAELTRVRHDDGSVTAAQTKFEAEILDLEAMNFNELRHHFTRAHIEQALRGYVKVHRDTRPLAGVAIKSITKAVFK